MTWHACLLFAMRNLGQPLHCQGCWVPLTGVALLTHLCVRCSFQAEYNVENPYSIIPQTGIPGLSLPFKVLGVGFTAGLSAGLDFMLSQSKCAATVVGNDSNSGQSM